MFRTATGINRTNGTIISGFVVYGFLAAGMEGGRGLFSEGRNHGGIHCRERAVLFFRASLPMRGAGRSASNIQAHAGPLVAGFCEGRPAAGGGLI